MIRRPTLNHYIPATSSLKECTRHWSPKTQPYASGDQLLCYLAKGWGIESRVEVEKHYFGPGRWTVIYHFGLRKDQNRLLMPVISGPFVIELITDNRDFLDMAKVRSLYRVRFQRIQNRTTDQTIDSQARR